MNFMINNVFSVTKGDRTYILSIPNGAPFGESIDFCFEVLERLSAMQKQVIDSSKPAESVEPTIMPPTEPTA